MEFTKIEAEDFLKKITASLNDVVFYNINHFLTLNPKGRASLNPAFPYPQTVNIGILKEHLVIEYIGPNNENTENFSSQLTFAQDKDLYGFLGIDIKHLNTPVVPWSDNMENINCFLGDSIDYLTDYFYDFTKQPEDFVMNGILDISQTNKPAVINNCTYFWSDEEGRLKIKHIDLVEIFPFIDGNIVYHGENSLSCLSEYIISSKVPRYDIKAHKILNEFIQLINTNPMETTITSFLEKNPIILQLSFSFNELNPQKILKWDKSKERPDLKPDFLPARMDGFCDIVEFKLPHLKSKPLVGKPTRTHPSYEIDQAVAQAEEYEEYIGQEVNRDWVKNNLNLKILNPRKYIIIGHSDEFTSEQRRKLRKTRDTVFFTYDEFIEMTRYQLYQIEKNI
ncbi:MAG: DUF4263 domain-containing protein [Desulfotalea sp.]